MSPILTKYCYESVISSDQSSWQRKYGMRGEIFQDILWDKKAPKFGATIMHGGNWIYIAYHYNPKLKPLILRHQLRINSLVPSLSFLDRFYMFDFLLRNCRSIPPYLHSSHGLGGAFFVFVLSIHEKKNLREQRGIEELVQMQYGRLKLLNKWFISHLQQG